MGREDLWPALEFLILGIQGEFQANVSVQLADTVAGGDTWEDLGGSNAVT